MTRQEKITKAIGIIEYAAAKVEDTLNHFRYLEWKEKQPSRKRRDGSGVFGGDYCSDTNFTGS